ncbi:hypothetical protein [Azospirillum himalayense]|uniref:Helix-turn-helix domain-containing protein n=1 Tax=Azospirillum himalayense TaxID=654847 RepID=A0ABW0GC22_9PROT
MVIDEGFAKSYRRRWSHPVFRNLRDAAIWAWMTDTAAWRSVRVRFADRLVQLERGQLVTSERFISEGFCVDRTVVRRLLAAMEQENMIVCRKSPAGTIITIVNYDQYQGDGEGTARPDITDEKPTRNPPHQPLETQESDHRNNHQSNHANYCYETDFMESAETSQPQVIQGRPAPATHQSEENQPNKKEGNNPKKELRESAETRANGAVHCDVVLDLTPVAVTTDAPGADAAPVALERVAAAGAPVPAKPEVPLWRRIIRAFDEIRVEVYGPELARANPATTDRTFAVRWIELGADELLCRDVFVDKINKAKKNKRSPPDTLRFLNGAVEDAIAEARSIREANFEGRSRNAAERSYQSAGRTSAHSALFDAAAAVDARLRKKEFAD